MLKIIVQCDLCGTNKEMIINDANEVYDIAWYHKRGYCTLRKQG